MNKGILLFNFLFPPNYGVGGKRWTVFSNQLATKGFKVHVISKKPAPNSKSNYDHLVTHPNIFVHHIKSYYPKILSSHKLKSFLEKVQYKLAVIFVRLFSRGNYYDNSIFLGI